VTGDRWFTESELEQMSRPTMDRAIEAIEAGDYESAIRLCGEMKNEWKMQHHILAENMLGLVSFIQEKFGEEYVGEAWTKTLEKGWKRETEAIVDADRRKVVEGLAATWRAHSTSGIGKLPGAFTVEEDDEKFTFTMNPCGSGQRFWRLGLYEGPDGYGVTKEPHDWSYGRTGFPLYCTHCALQNEMLPIKWYGLPLYPEDPPEDFDRDPCVWYWYKDPEDVPEEYWTRHGLSKTSGSRG